MIKKEIVLQHTGYVLKGISALTMWGGGEGTINMKPFGLDKLGLHAIIEGINDNGFGVESVDGAIVDVYIDYSGTLVYHDSILINIKNRLSQKQIDMLYEDRNNY